jgi:hypothetical protein
MLYAHCSTKTEQNALLPSGTKVKLAMHRCTTRESEKGRVGQKKMWDPL